MVTIKKASEITGVPAHTLRAWERRHKIFSPTRTPSGYRTYDEATIDRIRAMNDLVTQGWAPRDAAAEILRHTGQPAAPTTTPSGSAAAPAAGDFDDLLDAAARLDAERVARILDDQFARGDLESVLQRWLMPALVAVGNAWASGRISVAGEHLVANSVQRRLAASFEAAGRGSGRPVLVGAPPGGHHELGLLAFAAVARRAGLATLYLGADVPLDAWSEAVATAYPRAVVTAALRRSDAARAGQIAERLIAEQPGLTVWVGGRYQHLAPAPCRQLGHDLGEAAARLAEAPGSETTPDKEA